MGELLRVSFTGRGEPRADASPGQPLQGPAREHQRLWRLIWAGAPGIGWQRLQRLEAMFGGLEQAWQASGAELNQALAGRTALPAAALSALDRYRQQLGPEPLSWPVLPQQRRRWRQRGVLVHGDPALPPSLETLERPPLQLFWQGRGALWAALRCQQAVAVVGTRRPSRHGLLQARAIGRALAQAGWPVVSGLAEGIDAAAHEGCLEAGGAPVAVLGTPLERVYPRHHGQLQAAVGRQGLLVSELAAGTPGRAGHFALRNRLQVALAQAVVLVECPASSGALHSASLAWDQGMPLWVVPADTNRSSAAGSNRWLSQGATALIDPQDLINNLGAGPLRQPSSAQGPAGPAQGPLLQREAALLAALGAGASLDQLCDRLRQSPAQLSERLLQLELAGLLRSEPGLWWRPS